MESFHWITVPLSTILGLAITRLLSSLVAVFKSRSTARLTWMPLVWAACIFLLQFQLWWALFELPHLMKVWTLGYFGLFISLPLLLFLASALILPHQQLTEGQHLRDEFEKDGQWALVALSIYFTLTLTALWKTQLLSLMGMQNIALILLPVTCAQCRSKRGQEVLTLLFVVLVLWSAVLSSPASY